MVKKIKLSLILVGLLSSFSSFAQFSISGKITDENKEELVGASVYVTNLKSGVFSNVKGDFKIENLKAGKYILEFSFYGYKNLIQTVDLQNDIVLNIQLVSAVTELNEIVVTGVTRSTQIKLSPIVIKSVGSQDFTENSATNLIDGLQNVPGISQITTGSSVSKPVIRGLGYNRVISLHNGIRMEGQQWGDEHGIEIDEYAIDRVEIVKGPGSLIYGSDGIAGVLNFLSPKPLFDGLVKTQIVTNYQSNSNLIGYSLANSGNKNGFQWLGRFSNKFMGNYSNAYDGKVFNSGANEYNGTLFLGVNKNWGYSHLTVSSYNANLGMVEGERDSLGRFLYENELGEELVATANDLSGYTLRVPYQKINHLSIASNSYLILKKGDLKFDLGYQQNMRREFDDPEDPDEAELYLDLKTITYSIRYNLEKIKDWETTVGLGGMSQFNINKGEEYLIPDYFSTDLGAFLFTQRNFGKVILAGGLRFDNRWMNSKELWLTEEEEDPELKFSAFNRNYYGLSASAGISYIIDKKSTLKFNFSRGFRAPNIAELASNGVHEGTFRYEIGKMDLKNEASHQVDLAYYYESEHVSFEVTPFANYITNYIYLEKLKTATGLDSIPDSNNPAPAYQFTSGNALLYGGELFLDFHPHPVDWLHVENSFSIVHALQVGQTDSLKYLPFIPSPKYRGEVKATWEEMGKVFSNAYFKVGVEYNFKQNRVFSAFGTETETPGYFLLNVGAGIHIKAFNRKDFIGIYFVGQNLLNTAYQSHLSRLKYAPENPLTNRMGVYNKGRNFSVKLVLNI